MFLKVLWVVLCFHMLLPNSLASQTPREPADLQKYIDEIRRSGVSEMGMGHLAVIAGIRNGYTEFSFSQTPVRLCDDPRGRAILAACGVWVQDGLSLYSGAQRYARGWECPR